jgi:hypothetical protein
VHIKAICEEFGISMKNPKKNNLGDQYESVSIFDKLLSFIEIFGMKNTYLPLFSEITKRQNFFGRVAYSILEDSVNTKTLVPEDEE